MLEQKAKQQLPPSPKPYDSKRVRRGFPTTPARSAQMRAVRREGTKPEEIVRFVLDDLKVTYEQNLKQLPGSPDFVCHPVKTAVFVNGCFWHRHQDCRRATTPRKNRHAWQEKFVANVARDRRNARNLRKLGFAVITIWECQTADLGRLARRLTSLAHAATMKNSEKRRKNCVSKATHFNGGASQREDGRRRRAPEGT
jgi:DNA mismatch endonuclease (patch repair protein)